MLFGEFGAAGLILQGHLAFAAFPGVELMAVEQLHRLLVAAGLVEQGDEFEQKVVATSYEADVLAEHFEAFGVGTLHLL